VPLIGSGEFGENKLWVASLADIIKSKRAAGRSRDLAVLEILEKTLEEQTAVENKQGARRRSQSGE
jgi:hypothetical protein